MENMEVNQGAKEVSAYVIFQLFGFYWVQSTRNIEWKDDFMWRIDGVM